MTTLENVSGLLGRKIRLPLLVWIWRRDEDDFYQSEIVAKTGYLQSNVRDELERFASSGAITKFDRVRRSERQYYSRNLKHPIWRVVQAAASLEEIAPTHAASSRKRRS